MIKFLFLYFSLTIVVIFCVLFILGQFGLHKRNTTLDNTIYTENFLTSTGVNVKQKTSRPLNTMHFFGALTTRENQKKCINNLKNIGFAIEKFKKDHDGKMPHYLSDLYPTYINDQSQFICHHVSAELLNTGSPNGESKIRTKYLYEFSPMQTGHKTYRKWKTNQLKEFGDKVPVVRCFSHFGDSINLTYGGEIVFYETVWENSVPIGDLKDLDAVVRTYLRKMALAIQQYKIDQGEVPNELEDLVPDYVPKSKDITLTDESINISYQFTPNRPNTQTNIGATYREWKLKQIDDFGSYVPLIRVRGNFKNADVINLSYGLEIYESSGGWETDLIPNYPITGTN